MQDKKDTIKALYDISFPEDLRWNEWYFKNVYRDDDAYCLYRDDKLVSSLLMSNYTFKYRGTPVGMGYISGASTAPYSRHKGYMSELMVDVLRKARDKDFAFVSLIPASDRLYFFYDHFGFSTVFFVDRERYTSVHKFDASPDYVRACPSYEIFSALERMVDNIVLHSEEDYLAICADNAGDGGVITAATDLDGRPAAMAFAVQQGGECVVRALFAVNEDAAETVLDAVKQRFEHLPMVVWSAPTHRRASLRSRGMMRVVDVEKVLSILAASQPSIDQVIVVRDRLIADNNGIFKLSNGRCQRLDEKPTHVSLDVDVAILASILFSSEEIGRIFNLPTSHPQMPLMLD